MTSPEGPAGRAPPAGRRRWPRRPVTCTARCCAGSWRPAPRRPWTVYGRPLRNSASVTPRSPSSKAPIRCTCKAGALPWPTRFPARPPASRWNWTASRPYTRCARSTRSASRPWQGGTDAPPSSTPKTAPRSSFRRGAGGGLCAVAAGVEGGARAHLAASDWIDGEILSQEAAVPRSRPRPRGHGRPSRS